MSVPVIGVVFCAELSCEHPEQIAPPTAVRGPPGPLTLGEMATLEIPLDDFSHPAEVVTRARNCTNQQVEQNGGRVPKALPLSDILTALHIVVDRDSPDRWSGVFRGVPS